MALPYCGTDGVPARTVEYACHTDMCVCVCECRCMCICVCMLACVCVCVCMCMCVHMHVYNIIYVQTICIVHN